MLRLANREQVLEMDVASIEPERGDAVVSIKVASHGYTGHNEVWVEKETLRGFCSSLVELERSLKGHALIESMSPGELKVELLPVSSRGHFAVRGSTGYHIHGENGMYWHAVSFGFELELSELSRAVSEQLVQRHVG